MKNSGFNKLARAHWIAFALLTFIGVKMIYESITDKPNNFLGAYTIKVILILSIATSIDALAVGLSFSFLDIPIFFPARAHPYIDMFILEHQISNKIFMSASRKR